MLQGGPYDILAVFSFRGYALRVLSVDLQRAVGILGECDPPDHRSASVRKHAIVLASNAVNCYIMSGYFHKLILRVNTDINQACGIVYKESVFIHLSLKAG